MPFEHSYRDSDPICNVRDTNLRNSYLPDPNVDGELLFYLTEAYRVIRPSIVMMLAGCSRDEGHFLACLKCATIAFNYPTMAEGLAGEVLDTFEDQEAEDAGHAYNLVMLIAQEALQPDPTWQSISDLVQGMSGGRK